MMDKPVSAVYANRQFSSLLRSVREAGHSYVVTSHGRAVARIVPVDQNASVTSSARAALLERLAHEPVVAAGNWTRDALYEDA